MTYIIQIREEKLRRILFEFYRNGINKFDEILEKQKIEDLLEKLKEVGYPA